MIKVIYVSEDGQTFEYKSEKKDKEEVINDGYGKIKELGYEMYGYTLKNAEEFSEEFS